MAARSKVLSPEALAVLTDDVRIEGSQLFLTGGQLDRKLYIEVNAALDAIGGKWNKKAKAHLFEGDPSDALDQITTDGVFYKTKQELDQFFTPAALAKEVVDVADVRGHTVLEPSAGAGALALAAFAAGASSVVCVEKDLKLCEVLQAAREHARTKSGMLMVEGPSDFLESIPRPSVERVVMNPPFSRGRDIAHVTHAMKFLIPGRGKLVAIMSKGVTFRQDRAAKAFRAMLSESKGTVTDLPEDSFKASGTSVRTVLVSMRR